MEDYLKALLFALAPALGNFGGGLLAEAFNVSQRALSFALHAAAGVVIAVVAVELIPETLGVNPPWLPILAFVVGGVFFMGADRLIERVSGESEAGPWVLWFGVAIDLLSDGIMIGTGSSIDLGLGLLLAVGQTPADIPEGFAAIATFKARGVAKKLRMILAAAFAAPLFVGVTVGYWAVRGQPEAVKLSLLAFTAGVLVTVVVEEVVPESHQGDESKFATAFFIGGFALFSLLSAYLG